MYNYISYNLKLLNSVADKSFKNKYKIINSAFTADCPLLSLSILKE